MPRWMNISAAAWVLVRANGAIIHQIMCNKPWRKASAQSFAERSFFAAPRADSHGKIIQLWAAKSPCCDRPHLRHAKTNAVTSAPVIYLSIYSTPQQIDTTRLKGICSRYWFCDLDLSSRLIFMQFSSITWLLFAAWFMANKLFSLVSED